MEGAGFVFGGRGGGSSSSGAQSFTVDDANDSTNTDIVTLTHTTTVPTFGAVGMGAGILLRLEDDAGAVSEAGRISAEWTSATVGSEQSEFVFYLRDQGLALAGNARLSAQSGLSLTRNAISTNEDRALRLINSTAAAAGAQQYSPGLQLTGAGWGTTGGASQTVDVMQQLRTVQDTTSPSSRITTLTRYNAGAWLAVHAIVDRPVSDTVITYIARGTAFFQAESTAAAGMCDFTATNNAGNSLVARMGSSAYSNVINLGGSAATAADSAMLFAQGRFDIFTLGAFDMRVGTNTIEQMRLVTGAPGITLPRLGAPAGGLTNIFSGTGGGGLLLSGEAVAGNGIQDMVRIAAFYDNVGVGTEGTGLSFQYRRAGAAVVTLTAFETFAASANTGGISHAVYSALTNANAAGLNLYHVSTGAQVANFGLTIQSFLGGSSFGQSRTGQISNIFTSVGATAVLSESAWTFLVHYSGLSAGDVVERFRVHGTGVTVSNENGGAGSITDLLTLAVNTSGTAGANHGAGILFTGEDASGNTDDMVRLAVAWSTATSGSEASYFTISYRVAGAALTERTRFSPVTGMAHDVSDAATTTVSDILTLTHSTSGTAGTGYGGGILFTGEDASANTDNMGRLSFAWTDATSGSEDSKFTVQLRVAGAALATVFEVSSTGIATIVQTQTTTVGAAGGGSALPGAPEGYLRIVTAGTEYKVPYWPTAA